MRRLAVVTLLVGAACTQILGIEEGIPIGDECAVDEDVEEDGNPCTIEACVDGQPTHEATQGQIACYSGPEGTEGVGACHAGVLQCSAEGEPIGACEGEVLPTAECAGGSPGDAIDEDCDGETNEGEVNCVCGDQVTSEGEECDDGNVDDGDACVACKAAFCGDGVVEAGVEECDDGGVSPLDGCGATCLHDRVLALSSGSAHSCALLAGERIKCWGANGSGNLGQGDIQSRGIAANQMGVALPQVNLGTGILAAGVATGGQHTCALSGSGFVKCWGANGVGQLGLGHTEGRGDAPGEMGDALSFLDLGMNAVATAVATGGNHTCALLSGGVVKCWGANESGQLGRGDTAHRGDQANEMGGFLQAASLGTNKVAAAIAAGSAHTCAVLTDGLVKCWGANIHGQLGQGDDVARGDVGGEMGDTLLPVNLGTGKTATAVTAGIGHTCALLNDSSVKCWGWNGNGQLGLGDQADRGDDLDEMGDFLPAVDLGVGKTATSVAAGGYHTCVLLSDDSVKCWGYNNYGQLGLGDTLDRADGPGEMGDSLGSVDLGTSKQGVVVTAGQSYSCAILDDGSAKCWGANLDGQLGLGDTLNRGSGPAQMGDALPPVLLYSDTW